MADAAAGAPVLEPPREVERRGALDRLAAFRFTYLALFGFLVLYVISVQLAEVLLDRHFESAVASASHVEASEGQVVARIQQGVARAVRGSPWLRFGGVRVTPIVLGADGSTLYVGPHAVATPAGSDPVASLDEARRVLPVSTEVVSYVPHGSILANGILVLYAALLVQLLFVRSRTLARREAALLAQALEARDATAHRAERIEAELRAVRERLAAVEPGHETRSQEIRALESERAELQRQLDELARREEALRHDTGQVRSLEQERRALEELLDEAQRDLNAKDEAIRSLEARLKRAAKSPSSGGRAREGEQLARRLRTLYKNLEIDDRAVQDLVDLGDEAMKLKAEENLKRLSDDADHAAVRRKVGGLPPHLSIFELGFGGKGRIYYTRGRQRRFRVLLVGAKNSQKTDLEYLSRLPREE
jgi:predicted  nucleic acid-binding Zn-ribbon protein